ncbi:MAG: FHA domain-containing protein, partial [Planctomycetes bacterium]|nr:FHA domain-containing protein [Planctomycetota bacterium]
KKPKKEKEPELGNVKLIGIAGLVKEAQFSVGLGESVVVGRSSECNICLQDVPHAKAIEDNEQLEKHFRTVSRKHMRLTYHANDNIEIEDLSSNGLFLDGKRIEGKTTISDLVRRPYELKLGTTETFSLDWWKLVPKSSVKMVQVMVKREPEPEEEAPKKETGTIGEEF